MAKLADKPVSKKLYVCDNCRPPLHFTDGADQQDIANKTGKPFESMVEGQDFGQGVCPNCGAVAKEDGVHHWHNSVAEGDE